MSETSARGHLDWRALLAACSLPGVLVPLASVLHNGPWVSARFIEQSHYLPYWRAWKVAAPLEAWLAAGLAAYAAAIVTRTGRSHSRRCFALTWMAALIAGCALAFTARGIFWLEGPLYEWQPIHELVSVVFVLAMPSVGLFYFLGVPCLSVEKVRRPSVVPRAVFGAWAFASAVAGVALSWWLINDVLDYWGLRHMGPGREAFIVGLYFSWGAGAGAYAASRRLCLGQASAGTAPK